MSDFQNYLDRLTAAARAANMAEQEHAKAAAARAAELRAERAFAWRRLNLMRTIAAAVQDGEEAEAAAFACSCSATFAAPAAAVSRSR